MIVTGVYQILKKIRSDIPRISFITGKPPFDECDQWYKKLHESKEVDVE